MSGNQNNNHVQGSYRKLERRQRIHEKNAARERGRHWKGADTGKIARKCQPIHEVRRATLAQCSF
jgi:hypothetical protein